jgi:proteasome lid subunit RPN8/RPN11
MIEIPSAIREAMVAHAVEGLPNEACGLLAGTDGRVERFFPMANADRSHLTYSLDPKEHIRVEEEIWENGWSVVGIFHSHTSSQAFPSSTDRSRAGGYPDAAYLIVSLADRSNPSLRAFTIHRGDVEEQEVKIL